MLRPIFPLLTLALVIAGCRGPHYNVEDQPSSMAEPAVVERSSAPSVRKGWLGEARASAKAPLTWVAVVDWARVNAVVGPRRVSMSARPVYEVRTGRGTFTFQIGTTQARFNGMTVLLGFEPRVVGGKPCLHKLDVKNNLEPLLLSTPPDLAGCRIIVIDPGHGGGNTGTRSAGGDLEKNYTLDWALRLRSLLEANGWTVFLTRTRDTELTLPERVAFAEAAAADLFISLHFNASGNGTHQSGVETYCLTPYGLPSNLTRGFKDDPSIEYPNNAFEAQNLHLAVRLHRALLAVNGGEDRGIRRARFMGVLRDQNRPAVLLEGGFLSNPSEAAKISDPAYRQELAEAIASALGPPGTGG